MTFAPGDPGLPDKAVIVRAAALHSLLPFRAMIWTGLVSTLAP
jgi:hypothetical protein